MLNIGTRVRLTSWNDPGTIIGFAEEWVADGVHAGRTRRVDHYLVELDEGFWQNPTPNERGMFIRVIVAHPDNVEVR